MIGKGIFIWKSKHIEGGDLGKIVQACTGMGLSWVALKIGDGIDVRYASFPEAMAEAVGAFRAAGIAVWGWHYVYGGLWLDKSGKVHVGGPSPAQEAAFAVRQVNELGLAGYIIDAESEWKLTASGVASPGQRAATFMSKLQGIGAPVALCSYRFPSYHPEFPWEAFLAGCELHMPQVYWGPGRAVNDLDRSVQELRKKKLLPIVPLGRAYIGDGYPTPGPSGEELRGFMQRAVERGCPGASFWALDFLYMHAGGEERKAAIGEYEWGSAPEPEPEPVMTAPKVLGKIRVMAYWLNVRAGHSMAAADMGDLKQGSEFYVMDVWPPDQGNGYQAVEWVMIGAGLWIGVGRNLCEWVERYDD